MRSVNHNFLIRPTRASPNAKKPSQNQRFLLETHEICQSILGSTHSNSHGFGCEKIGLLFYATHETRIFCGAKIRRISTKTPKPILGSTHPGKPNVNKDLGELLT